MDTPALPSAATIGTETFSASFLVADGMLGTSLRHHGHEFVASPNPVERYRTGSLTGIPLLHPWANRLDRHGYTAAGLTVTFPNDSVPVDGHGRPIHGTMHGRHFTLDAHSDDALHAHYEFGTPQQLESFPFPHRLDVSVATTETGDRGNLAITTTLHNTGTGPLPVSFGWHPYLTIPSTRRAEWQIRVPACTHVELDAECMPTGTSNAQPVIDGTVGAGTFDDHYALGTDRRFVVADAVTTIAVEFDDQYPYAQIYLPPDHASGTEFVCFEPMTAPLDALTHDTAPLVAPGATFAATFTITVEPTRNVT